MWLLAVVALLPFIYLFSWVAAPFLFVFGRNMHFAEKLYGYSGYAAWAFYMVIIMLVVMSGHSKRFFWFGLLPVLLIGAWLGGWH